jgi:hypothetical protein
MPDRTETACMRAVLAELAAIRELLYVRGKKDGLSLQVESIVERAREASSLARLTQGPAGDPEDEPGPF